MTRLTLMVFAGCASCNLAHADIVIAVSEDALINSTDNSNHNTGQFRELLASETGPANGYWGSWMKFDVSGLQGQNYASVTLELTAFLNHDSTPIAHEVFSSTNDSWTEGTITGLSQPGENTLTSLDVTQIPNVNGLYTWDITAAIAGAGADGVLTLFIRPETFPVGVSRGPHFRSREAGFAIPQLRATIPTPATLALVGAACLAAPRKRQRAIP